MTAAVVGAPVELAETRVVHTRVLGESYVRLVLAGEDLSAWAAEVIDPGSVADAYVKLNVPPPGARGTVPDPADLRGWLALPETERGWMRTYTVRRADRVVVDGRQVPALTVDVVVHPGVDEGPGSSWARQVRVGDTLRVLGPGRGHAPWAAWAPGRAGRVVCAGDETAAPALLSIAEQLAAEPEGLREARSLIEVPTVADAHALGSRAPEAVTVVPRAGDPGVRLLRHLADVLDLGADCVETVLQGRRPAEREWQPATAVSAGDPYVFLAGEAGLVRAMRRLAVDAAGIQKEAVAFMGYWRRGAAES